MDEQLKMDNQWGSKGGTVWNLTLEKKHIVTLIATQFLANRDILYILCVKSLQCEEHLIPSSPLNKNSQMNSWYNRGIEIVCILYFLSV